jgi:hypothetical protein
MVNRRTRYLLVATAALLIAPSAARATTNEREKPVNGKWATLVPVAFTSYEPTPGHPLTGSYEGVGSTEWQGTWRGITKYSIGGSVDLVTGAGSGWLHEKFIGRFSDGRVGTLTLDERYTLTSTGEFHVDARIVSGTRDFAHASGHVRFAGRTAGAAFGVGTYTGSWRSGS